MNKNLNEGMVSLKDPLPANNEQRLKELGINLPPPPAHWPFLSDSGGVVQKDLEIAEYTDPVHNPMIPHVIVLEPGLVIYKVYNGYWFFGRPTVEDLRQDLRAAIRKCRPNWDITTPEMKEAWRQGHKEVFLSVRQNVRANSRRTRLGAVSAVPTGR